MVKRNREPDLRLSHHDPTMPVIRSYLMPDGTTQTIVDPDYESRYRAHLIDHAPHPNWRNDPTYHMAKPRKPRS